MSKAYKKEKRGVVQGSFVSPEVYRSAHTPEEEKQFLKLVERIQPLIMQTIKQQIDIYLEEHYDIHEGDFIQYVIQYIYQYFYSNPIVWPYGAGKGIDGSALGASVIKVFLGGTPEGLKFGGDGGKALQVNYSDGLDLSGSALVAKADDGIAISEAGIKVDLASTTTTTGDGGGLKLTDSDGTGKLQVAPEDFLKLAE